MYAMMLCILNCVSGDRFGKLCWRVFQFMKAVFTGGK